MTTLANLYGYCIEKSKEYPELKEEIMDFYQLASDEVESGESESHEVELAVSSIEQLIEENN